MPKKRPLPILLVDSREKTPFDFDGDEDFASIKTSKLDAGDYSIEGIEHIIVIERKANVDELYTNFTKDKERIYAEFDRLREHRTRIILIEQSCDDVLNPHQYFVNKKGLNKQDFSMPPAVVAATLTDIMLKYNAHIIFAGSKGKTMTKGILLAAYKLHMQGKLKWDSPLAK